jgi:hypothetical protein
MKDSSQLTSQISFTHEFETPDFQLDIKSRLSTDLFKDKDLLENENYIIKILTEILTAGYNHKL